VSVTDFLQSIANENASDIPVQADCSLARVSHRAAARNSCKRAVGTTA